VPFHCSYDLDQRLDRELVNLNQSLYRRLQSALSDGYKLQFSDDGFPNAVQYYLLYVAALIYGAADAALTLTLHNLGREARVLERQIFEYWLRAAYFADHPEEARVALHSTPFQEKKLLDEFGYTKESDRYREVLESCDIVEGKMPAAKQYREPSVRQIIDPKNNPDLARFYALHYRASSQMAHASFNGVGGVWGPNGLSFDSRQDDPNFTIVSVTKYLLVFIELAHRELRLGLDADIDEFRRRFMAVQERLATLERPKGAASAESS
jgi:hypothetical protein